MSAQKHTPGPWFAHTSPPADAASVWAEAEDHLEDASPIAVCTDHREDGRPVAECQANARLVAAAPDLLAALRPFVEPFDLFSDDVLRSATDPAVKVRGISTREARLVWAGRRAIAAAEGWNVVLPKTINNDVDASNR